MPTPEFQLLTAKFRAFSELHEATERRYAALLLDIAEGREQVSEEKLAELRAAIDRTAAMQHEAELLFAEKMPAEGDSGRPN